MQITLEHGDRVRAGAAVEALPSRLSRLPFSLSLRICVHSPQNLCPPPSQSMSLSLRVIASEVVSTTVRHNCRDALFLQSELLSEITIVQKTKFVRSHLLFPILSKGDGPTFQLSRQIVGFNIVFMSEMFSLSRLQLDERWQAILVVWLQNPLDALTESQITAHWF